MSVKFRNVHYNLPFIFLNKTVVHFKDLIDFLILTFDQMSVWI